MSDEVSSEAGAGLWIIRLHSNESGWSGRWMYGLEPR